MLLAYNLVRHEMVREGVHSRQANKAALARLSDRRADYARDSGGRDKDPVVSRSRYPKSTLCLALFGSC